MFYAAIERFDAENGDRWVNYLRWLGRSDLKQIVTLDSTICPPLVHPESGSDWDFVVKEEFMINFFTDLNFVLRRAKEYPRAQVVAVARNPSAQDVEAFTHQDFEFAGFDVVDPQFIASALLNAAKFPEALSIRELEIETGLIGSRKRANQIRE